MSDQNSHEAAEAGMRTAFTAGDYAGATTIAIRLYGPEVLGFLAAVLRNDGAAEEAFSLCMERLWRGIERFEWKCSMRTWLYVLARHASADVRRGDPRQKRPHASPSEAAISQLAELVRTETLSILKTERRNAFTRMRDELSVEDRTLLVLRVDRNLPFRDIAQIMGAADDETVVREAARLRKRFQLVKDRLREQAKERGLM